MGTQVIARRWRAVADRGTGSPAASTAGAGRYLTLDPQTDRWRALCLRLQDRPGDDAAAHRAVAAATAIFDHFAAALALNPPASRPQPVPEPVNV